jgi:hypothetical protein
MILLREQLLFCRSLVHSGSDSAAEARVIVRRYGKAMKDSAPTLGDIDRRSGRYLKLSSLVMRL